jgi:membrane-bound ClpP family serine protease
MGPVVLITIGVLFLIQEFSHDYLSFVRLSPIILIVIGAVKILRAVAPSDGHISTDAPTPTPAAPGAAQPNGQ